MEQRLLGVVAHLIIAFVLIVLLILLSNLLALTNVDVVDITLVLLGILDINPVVTLLQLILRLDLLLVFKLIQQIGAFLLDLDMVLFPL